MVQTIFCTIKHKRKGTEHGGVAVQNEETTSRCPVFSLHKTIFRGKTSDGTLINAGCDGAGHTSVSGVIQERQTVRLCAPAAEIAHSAA